MTMTQSLGAWTPLYPGVEWLSTTVPFSAVSYPQPIAPYPTINLVRVHLDDPHVTTYSTPASGLNANGVTLTEFLTTTFEAQKGSAVEGIIGINANYFDYGSATSNIIYGLAVSNRQPVSTRGMHGGDAYYPVLITEANGAVIGPANAPAQPDTWTAVSGNVLLLQGGQVMVPQPSSSSNDPVVAARTVIGLSYRPNCLYMLTIDGIDLHREFTPPYYGATYFDVAMLMLVAGATEAVNMDGGGSTTMARIGTATTSGPVLMNMPHGEDGTPVIERAVGNCFAVISRGD
jgi:hypothetical protein